MEAQRVSTPGMFFIYKQKSKHCDTKQQQNLFWKMQMKTVSEFRRYVPMYKWNGKFFTQANFFLNFKVSNLSKRLMIKR